MKEFALFASTALGLAVLICSGSAFAAGDGPHIEVHRMGQAFGPGGPADIAPGNGYGLLERARIRERAAIDNWDVVIPPAEGDPDEDPAGDPVDDDTGIFDLPEEDTSDGWLVYPDLFDGGGSSSSGTWVAPTPGAQIPEPATILLAGLGLAAVLLRRRR